ncbi:MAG: dynactin p62 family-domain-containing protein [Linnemannia elongata]|nr:MAG: dynactin p62 family-domain-containing protein [Linnemannia elongata]
MATMLALNAPPSQAPVIQPFVHYRCLCSSPGPSATASRTPSTTRTATPTRTSHKDDKDMDIDPTTTPTTTTDPTPSSPSADLVPATAALTLHQQHHSHHRHEQDSAGERSKTPAEVYDSGNNSDPHGSHSLSRLYFCDSCDEIRCPKCTQDEIVCYYCPNCLFDVPTASVKSEKHKCSRNCFECPICQSTLSVVSEDPDAGMITAGVVTPGQYHLACNMCQWNSQEIGMNFEKPTGLAVQIQKTEDSLPDVKEFDRLKDHLEKYFRVHSLKPGLPSSLLTSIQSGTLQSLRYVSTSSHKAQLSDDIAHYTPAVQVMEDTENLEKLMSITNLSETTTMKQRLRQLQNQTYSTQRLQPQRIHLRIKKSRRCRSCRHILVKPEQKAQATGFKINLIALSQLPNITIAGLQPMIVQTVSRVILRFTNPRHEEAHISLRYGDGAIPNHGVVIHSPSFTVSPFNEVWEYEVGTMVTAPGAVQEDVYERTANSTSIALDITPAAAGEVKIPLLVTFTFKSHKLQSDTEPSALPTQLVVSGSKDHPAPEIELIDKTVAFWTVIGFGEALPTFS